MLNPMFLEKRPLSLNEIENQTALVLPDRETPTPVIVTCLAVCVGQIKISIKNIDVLNFCAQIQAITVDVLGVQTQVFKCEVRS